MTQNGNGNSNGNGKHHPKKKGKGKGEDVSFSVSMKLDKEGNPESAYANLYTTKTITEEMFYEVPEDANIEGTLFDFFKQYNMIEFYRQDNPLNEKHFAYGLSKLLSIFSTGKHEVGFNAMQYVIVSVVTPTAFFDFMKKTGLEMTQAEDRDWQYHVKYGTIDVTLVICDKLPFDPKYFSWLVFAPESNENRRKAFEYMRASNDEDFKHILESFDD